MITKTLFVIKKKKKRQRIQKLIFCETEKEDLLDIPTTSHQDRIHYLGTSFLPIVALSISVFLNSL